MAKPCKVCGFTIIELMVAVAVTGILAAIAYPTYQNAMMKGRRADGKAALVTLQLAEEKMRAMCSFYAGTLGAASNTCGATAAATTLNNSAASADGYYTLAISSADDSSYSLTATPTGLKGQDQDTDCVPLVITNAAGTISKSPAGCW